MTKKHDNRRTLTAESYLFEIVDVDPGYGFHVGYDRFEPGAFGEHLHIGIATKCLRPKKFEGRETRFTFIGDRALIAQIEAIPDGRAKPNGVGTLTMRGGRSEYLGALPYDAASVLPLVILAGGYRFIYLSGPPTHHGSTRIQSCSFYRDYDADDI